MYPTSGVLRSLNLPNGSLVLLPVFRHSWMQRKPGDDCSREGRWERGKGMNSCEPASQPACCFLRWMGQLICLVCVFTKTVLLVPHYQNNNTECSKFFKVFKYILVKWKVLISFVYCFFFPLDLLIYLFQICISQGWWRYEFVLWLVNCFKDGDNSVVKLSLCLWLLA